MLQQRVALSSQGLVSFFVIVRGLCSYSPADAHGTYKQC